MIDNNNVSRLIGAPVLDSNGVKIGSLEQIYSESGSGAPRWMRVRTGLFGTSHTIVPAPVTAERDSNDSSENTALRISVDKAFVKHAPRIETEGPLTPPDEDALARYYGLETAGPAADAAAADSTATAAGSGRHSSGEYSPDDGADSATSESNPGEIGTDDADESSLGSPAPRAAGQGRHRADE